MQQMRKRSAIAPAHPRVMPATVLLCGDGEGEGEGDLWEEVVVLLPEEWESVVLERDLVGDGAVAVLLPKWEEMILELAFISLMRLLTSGEPVFSLPLGLNVLVTVPLGLTLESVNVTVVVKEPIEVCVCVWMSVAVVITVGRPQSLQ